MSEQNDETADGCEMLTATSDPAVLYQTLCGATEIEQLKRERDEAREEAEEQARLLGMSAQRESDLLGKLIRIKIAAENVILQWDSPSWKLTEPTAGVIYRLRNAIGMDE